MGFAFVLSCCNMFKVLAVFVLGNVIYLLFRPISVFWLVYFSKVVGESRDS